MKTLEPNTDAYRDLAEALNAERTAQLAYAKYFLVVDSPKAEPIALLRLAHTDACHALENILNSYESPIPEYTGSTGPFTDDPRQAVFGIDDQLVYDYLISNERRLEEVWRRLVAVHESLASVFDERLQILEELLGNLESKVNPQPAAKAPFLRDPGNIAS